MNNLWTKPLPNWFYQNESCFSLPMHIPHPCCTEYSATIAPAAKTVKKEFYQHNLHYHWNESDETMSPTRGMSYLKEWIAVCHDHVLFHWVNELDELYFSKWIEFINSTKKLHIKLDLRNTFVFKLIQAYTVVPKSHVPKSDAFLEISLNSKCVTF